MGAPGSLRRTSTVDITVDDSDSRLTLHGAAQDVAAGADGSVEVVRTATTRTVIDIGRGTVSELTSTPSGGARTASLLGASVRSGFRRAVRETLPGLVDDGSLVGLLLDEVPVATVVGGSLLRRRPSALDKPMARPPVDVCSGWQRGGLLATTTLATGNPPMGSGPVAVPLSDVSEGRPWHDLAPLPAWSMRRARSIDRLRVGRGDDAEWELVSLFRDTRTTGDGVERVVHEYAVGATVGADGTILRIEAVPRTLPAPECPAAAASAQRLVGVRVVTLRDHVALSFRGTSTCTHLNDTLRALGDLDSLLNSDSDE